ncbi:hypothetical protein AURDEDRAFT_76417, partial [Auricularia subglabra TFB-10046 SS5]
MSNQTQTATLSGGYRIEMLSGSNWLPWKRRMLAIMRDSDLEMYIKEGAERPKTTATTDTTAKDAELAAQKAWDIGDSKARTRIELSVGDSEMVHLTGAETAREMWEQLIQVKEARGRSGILA